MHIALSEEQTFIRDMARKFAVAEIAPIAGQLDRDENPAKNRELFLANLKKLAELGFMGLNVSSDFGGSDAGVVSFSVAITEIAKACASTAVTMSVTNMVSEVIQTVANEEQKQRYLPKLLSGDYAAGSFCLSEQGAGSNPAAMQTKALRDGDQWVINGTKAWITSAEYSGLFVVWAVTDADAPSGKGISCFLVEANTPGLTLGKAEQKMGQHASTTNMVSFDNCRIPDSALMGELNDGFRIAVTELAGGRIGIGSLALGVGFAAMDYARQYTTEREQFGRSLADFQGLQWMISDAYTQLEASRLLLMNAAYLKESGKPFNKAAAMAKLHATETGNKVCYTAQQLLGGMGYTQDSPLERYARDVRVTSVYEGTSEIQRIIIARELFNEL